jgi:hypothetical protein
MWFLETYLLISKKKTRVLINIKNSKTSLFLDI